MKLAHAIHHRLKAGLTLLEVLAAGTIIAIGATAAASLASTSMLQEELAFRVATTRNYQENMLRLWQLGLSPAQILAIMPDQDQNQQLQLALYGTTAGGDGPLLQETALEVLNGVTVETASCQAIVNISQDPGTEILGADLTLRACRPRLITTLRTPAP